MSRRIHQTTDITDKDLAIQALNQAGIMHEVRGNMIYMSSGDFKNASLDLSTGNIEGDSDYGHKQDRFGVLRQHYSSAKVKAEFLKTGTVIDEETTDEEGSIVLMWHMA